jgi:hypothetical protein
MVVASAPALADEPKAAPEPTAGALASARSALREGLALREKGDTAAALARLQSAWDFVPTPITGFELGKTHLMLGHVLQAHEMFAHVGRLPSSVEESSRSQSARDESVRLMKDLEPRIPSLRVKLAMPANAPASASADVKVDDEKLTLNGNEAKLFVEVGPHDIVAKAGDGPEQKVHVEVAESEVKDVQLTPQWVAPQPKPVVGPTGQVLYVRQTNPLTFIGFGIAAAGIVVTSISAVVFFNARDDARDRCGQNYCPPQKTSILGPTNPIYDAEYDSARARYNGSIVFMIAGAVTTVVFGGIGAVFAARPIKERVTASGPTITKPTFGLGGAGLEGTF